ncbi:VOC family protein [Candidatus Bipolaricaulota sp. J31]
MFRKLAPMFLVGDVERAARFYREVLGGKLAAVYPEQPPYEWVSLKLGEVELMFWEVGAAVREYPGLEIPENLVSFIAYIYVDGLDALYERVREAAEVLMEPVDQFYGMREFTIRDPFGFVLTFAQEKAGGK